MSKNITIQEGGSAKMLTVDRLRTNLADGGSCLWVPEDSVPLGEKTITEDGTYLASDEGLYGYSRVTVRGLGAATVTIPKGSAITGDGNEYAVKAGSSGEMKLQPLPSSITVESPPNLTEYADGEAIDFTGLVVRAHLKDGEIWTDADHPSGAIPLSELIVSARAADLAAAARTGLISTDLPVEPNPFEIAPANQYSCWILDTFMTPKRRYKRTHSWYDAVSPVWCSNSKYYYFIFASDAPTTVETHYEEYIIPYDDWYGLTDEEIARSQLGELDRQEQGTVEVKEKYTYLGKTVYYAYRDAGSYQRTSYRDAEMVKHADSSQNTYDKAVPMIAWAMLYGDRTESGAQTVRLSWVRPDGEVLETTFDIDVKAASETGGETGGGQI